MRIETLLNLDAFIKEIEESNATNPDHYGPSYMVIGLDVQGARINLQAEAFYDDGSGKRPEHSFGIRKTAVPAKTTLTISRMYFESIEFREDQKNDFRIYDFLSLQDSTDNMMTIKVSPLRLIGSYHKLTLRQKLDAHLAHGMSNRQEMLSNIDFHNNNEDKYKDMFDAIFHPPPSGTVPHPHSAASRFTVPKLDFIDPVKEGQVMPDNNLTDLQDFQKFQHKMHGVPWESQPWQKEVIEFVKGPPAIACDAIGNAISVTDRVSKNRKELNNFDFTANHV